MYKVNNLVLANTNMMLNLEWNKSKLKNLFVFSCGNDVHYEKNIGNLWCYFWKLNFKKLVNFFLYFYDLSCTNIFYTEFDVGFSLI